MTPEEAAAELTALRERYAPTLAADLAALNRFQRVHVIAWACRLAHPIGDWAPTVKPVIDPRQGRRVPQCGDGRRALEYRQAVYEAVTRAEAEGIGFDLEVRAACLAIAKGVLEGVGYAISNDSSNLPPVGRRKPPLVVPVDEETSDDDEPSWSAA